MLDMWSLHLVAIVCACVIVKLVTVLLCTSTVYCNVPNYWSCQVSGYGFSMHHDPACDSYSMCINT